MSPDKCRGAHVIAFVSASVYVSVAWTKTLMLFITQIPQEVGFSYFECVSFMTRPFTSYHYLWPWSLTYFCRTLTLAITQIPQAVGLSYFTCVFLETREKGIDLTRLYDKSPYIHRQILNATWQHKNATKTSITQPLRTDSVRLVGVTIATQLVWFNRFTGS